MTRHDRWTDWPADDKWRELAERQTPLEPEVARRLYDNLWDLYREDPPRPDMAQHDPDADHRRMSPAWARHIPTGPARRRIDWLNVFVWFALVPLVTVGGWGLILWLVL